MIGAAFALCWANADPKAYHALQEWVIIDHSFVGHVHPNEAGEMTRTLTLHYLVNGVLMALFFAIAGKEINEAIFLKTHDDKGNEREKGGKMRGKKALTPLIATLGGMLGPVIVYLCIASIFGSTTLEAIQRGWAIPTATDIAFSYIVGRLVFGEKHPAVSFLLLLAVADDAGGLLVLAVFYPTSALHLEWLLVSVGAAILSGMLFNFGPRLLDARFGGRRFQFMRSFGAWPYIIAGVISWYAFQESGIHPALGLLPIIPMIPHADADIGIFAEEEKERTDLLNVMEHAIKLPVQFVLFAFAFLNAGITFTMPEEATWAVLGGLLLGKPIGIFLFGMFAAYVLRLGLPKGMRPQDLFVLGCVAAIGFTVALFVSVVAFVPGGLQDAAKMGALLSILAVIPAFFFGGIFRVKQKILPANPAPEESENTVAA